MTCGAEVIGDFLVVDLFSEVLLEGEWRDDGVVEIVNSFLAGTRG